MVIAEARIESWNPAVALKLAPLVRLDDDQLFDLCQLNRDLRIERDADGVLVLMAPVGGASSARNLELSRPLATWAQRDGSGVAFDASAGFVLPNGAMRSPDAAWIRRERWEALSAEQRERFVPLCPDFVVELRSPSGGSCCGMAPSWAGSLIRRGVRCRSTAPARRGRRSARRRRSAPTHSCLASYSISDRSGRDSPSLSL
jgi:hypothetical protein